MSETTAEFQARVAADMAAHCHGPLSEEITYTPDGGSGSTFRALVHDQGKRLESDDEGTKESMVIEVEIAVSDVATPAVYDVITYEGANYTVEDVQPDPVMGVTMAMAARDVGLAYEQEGFRNARR